MTDRQRNMKIFIPAYVIFAVIYIYSALIDPNFISWGNNVNLIQRIAPLIFIAIAQTFVLLSGGIDLSVGAMVGLANVVAASLPYQQLPADSVLWIVVPIAVTVLAGTINGLLVAKAKFPPIIATLATASVFQGIALFIMPQPGGSVPMAATNMTRLIGGVIPVPAIMFLLALVVAHLVLTRTYFGRSIYAVGGNPQIAFESGVPVQRVTIGAYMVGGLFCGLGGVFLSARIFSGDPLIGEPYVLDSIAASVIGGTSLFVGRGGVVGILGGAYVFKLIGNILNLMNVSAFYQYLVRGIVLIIALLITSSDASDMLGRWFRDKVGKPLQMLLGRRRLSG